MSNGVHLAWREVWRNRARFLLFSLVIALITLLILFVAALSEGLGLGNREYLEKLDADLIVFQDTAQIQIAASQVSSAQLRAIRRINGVKAAGAIAFAGVSVPRANARPMDVSLIGVEPGLPGNPPVVTGVPLYRTAGDDAIVDAVVVEMTGLQVGDTVTLRSIQEDRETFYDLTVIGITDSQKYSLRSAVFVPLETWDRIRSQAVAGGTMMGDLPHNIAAVQLVDPTQASQVRRLILEQVSRVDVADRQTTWENAPGYSEQQSTLNTQRGFALLIGVLVIGGFFQIQTLQKVGQIGMLKAVGTPNLTIAVSSLLQIIMVTLIGVLIGGAAALGLAQVFPGNVPIVFTWRSGLAAVASILVMGPLGGLVSIRYALKVEPLTALGLTS
jgi:putative ABC transport system permease protein